MLTEGVVTTFAELFEGRRDVFGTDAGGCTRVPGHPGAVWPRMAKAHLGGEKPIGVYPMVYRAAVPNTYSPEWQVKWGAVDFDIKSEAHRSWDYETEEDAHVAAVNLQKVLKHIGVTSWIERTRSRGRHLWIFTSSWATAASTRRALLVACSVAGVSPREVNPKQETLAEGQVGSYVRLPYPGALTDNVRSGSRQVMIGVDPLASFTLEYFLNKAMPARTSPQTLEAIAAKWKPLPEGRVTINFPLRYEGDPLQLVSRLTATGRSVFTNGPNDGDRSRGMVYLAKQAKLSGLEPSEAAILLASAHWNKYRGRADEVKQLRDIVERAWT